MRINRRNKDVKNTLGRFHTPTVARASLHVSGSSSSWQRHPPAGVCDDVVSTWHRDPHTGPGALQAATEEGGSAAPSAGFGKLSRLMCIHPRRRTSASYARAASCLVANRPIVYLSSVPGTCMGVLQGWITNSPESPRHWCYLTGQNGSSAKIVDKEVYFIHVNLIR